MNKYIVYEEDIEKYITLKRQFIDLIHSMSYNLKDRTLSQLMAAFKILKDPW